MRSISDIGYGLKIMKFGYKIEYESISDIGYGLIKVQVTHYMTIKSQDKLSVCYN